MFFLFRLQCANRKGLTLCILRQLQTPVEAKTVDSIDVQNHGQLKEIWWDENGSLKGLHTMNLVRVPFITNGLLNCPSEETTTPLLNKKILDAGCGGGILSEELARLGACVTGIDAGNDLIDLAINHSMVNLKLHNNLPSYFCTSIEEHCQQRKNYYDAVVASKVIEHVHNKELFIKSCVKL